MAWSAGRVGEDGGGRSRCAGCSLLPGLGVMLRGVGVGDLDGLGGTPGGLQFPPECGWAAPRFPDAVLLGSYAVCWVSSYSSRTSCGVRHRKRGMQPLGGG